MRGAVKNRNIPRPDNRYKSANVAKFVNYVMLDGKKSVAQKALYDAFDVIKKQLKTEDPLLIFEQALQNVAPTMEVRSRRVGGANYQVPYPVRPERQTALAMRWLLEAARSKSGSPMAKRLADEIIAASNNEGEAMKKRENTHKMAEANKAFAHFAVNRSKKK